MAVGSNDLDHHHQDLPNAQQKQVSQNMQQQATDRRRGAGMHVGACATPAAPVAAILLAVAATTAQRRAPCGVGLLQASAGALFVSIFGGQECGAVAVTHTGRMLVAFWSPTGHMWSHTGRMLVAFWSRRVAGGRMRSHRSRIGRVEVARRSRGGRAEVAQGRVCHSESCVVS